MAAQCQFDGPSFGVGNPLGSGCARRLPCRISLLHAHFISTGIFSFVKVTRTPVSIRSSEALLPMVPPVKKASTSVSLATVLSRAESQSFHALKQSLPAFHRKGARCFGCEGGANDSRGLSWRQVGIDHVLDQVRRSNGKLRCWLRMDDVAQATLAWVD